MSRPLNDLRKLRARMDHLLESTKRFPKLGNRQLHIRPSRPAPPRLDDPVVLDYAYRVRSGQLAFADVPITHRDSVRACMAVSEKTDEASGEIDLRPEMAQFGGLPFRYHYDITPSVLLALAERSSDKQMRGLVNAKDAYWWNAESATHVEVKKHLGLGGARFQHATLGKWIDGWHLSVADPAGQRQGTAELQRNSLIQKLLPLLAGPVRLIEAEARKPKSIKGYAQLLNAAAQFRRKHPAGSRGNALFYQGVDLPGWVYDRLGGKGAKYWAERINSPKGRKQIAADFDYPRYVREYGAKEAIAEAEAPKVIRNPNAVNSVSPLQAMQWKLQAERSTKLKARMDYADKIVPGDDVPARAAKQAFVRFGAYGQALDAMPNFHYGWKKPEMRKQINVHLRSLYAADARDAAPPAVTETVDDTLKFSTEEDMNGKQWDFSTFAYRGDALTTQTVVGGIDYSVYDDKAQIQMVRVKQSERGKGVGTALIRAMLSHLRKWGLSVRYTEIQWSAMTPDGVRLKQKADRELRGVRESLQDAIDYYGVTNSSSEAFYILPDGRMLDGSGKKHGGSPGLRSYDHREVSIAGMSMDDMLKAGAIRFGPEGMVFDLYKSPTAWQRHTIRRIAAEVRGQVIVEVTPNGQENKRKYREFIAPTSGATILKWIDDAMAGKDVPVTESKARKLKALKGYAQLLNAVAQFRREHPAGSRDTAAFYQGVKLPGWVYDRMSGKGAKYWAERINNPNGRRQIAADFDYPRYVREYGADESVDEVADAPAKVTWVAQRPEQWKGRFNAGGYDYLLRITRSDDDDTTREYEVEFAQSKQGDITYDLTKTGRAGEVLSYVTSAIKDFIDEMRPDTLVFFAKETSRINVYRALLKRALKSVSNYEPIPEKDKVAMRDGTKMGVERKVGRGAVVESVLTLRRVKNNPEVTEAECISVGEDGAAVTPLNESAKLLGEKINHDLTQLPKFTPYAKAQQTAKQLGLSPHWHRLPQAKQSGAWKRGNDYHIVMGEKADLQTQLHELGHIYWNQHFDSPEDRKRANAMLAHIRDDYPKDKGWRDVDGNDIYVLHGKEQGTSPATDEEEVFCQLFALYYADKLDDDLAKRVGEMMKKAENSGESISQAGKSEGLEEARPGTELYHTTDAVADILRARQLQGEYVSLSETPVYGDITGRTATIVFDRAKLRGVQKVEYSEDWYDAHTDLAGYIAGEGWREQYTAPDYEDYPSYDPDDSDWEPGSDEDDEFEQAHLRDAELSSFLHKSDEREWIGAGPIRFTPDAVNRVIAPVNQVEKVKQLLARAKIDVPVVPMKQKGMRRHESIDEAKARLTPAQAQAIAQIRKQIEHEDSNPNHLAYSGPLRILPSLYRLGVLSPVELRDGFTHVPVRKQNWGKVLHYRHAPTPELFVKFHPEVAAKLEANESIDEVRVETVTLRSGWLVSGNKEIRVWRNPTKAELLRLAAKQAGDTKAATGGRGAVGKMHTREHVLRGLLIDNDYIWWSAMDGNHDEVGAAFGVAFAGLGAGAFAVYVTAEGTYVKGGPSLARKWKLPKADVELDHYDAPTYALSESLDEAAGLYIVVAKRGENQSVIRAERIASKQMLNYEFQREFLARAFPGRTAYSPLENAPKGAEFVTVWSSQRRDGVGRTGSMPYEWAIGPAKADEATTIARGDCFRWATLNKQPGDVLVHGEAVVNAQGKRGPHAWLERAGKVYDWQGDAGIREQGMDLKAWRAEFKPSNERRYEKGALKMVTQHGHYGPWESADDFDDAPDDPPVTLQSLAAAIKYAAARTHAGTNLLGQLPFDKRKVLNFARKNLAALSKAVGKEVILVSAKYSPSGRGAFGRLGGGGSSFNQKAALKVGADLPTGESIDETDTPVYYRYVHRSGMGLMNNQGLNRSRLSDDEEAELIELLDFGLEQPRGVPASAVFAFTAEGNQKHKRLIQLLTKASKSGVTMQKLPASDYKVVWSSDDGQVALIPAKTNEETISQAGKSEPIEEAVKLVADLAKTGRVVDHGMVGWMRVYSYVPSKKGQGIITPAEHEQWWKAQTKAEPDGPYIDSAVVKWAEIKPIILKAQAAILATGAPKRRDVLVLRLLEGSNSITGGSVGGYAYRKEHGLEVDLWGMLADSPPGRIIVHEWAHRTFFQLPKHVRNSFKQYYLDAVLGKLSDVPPQSSPDGELVPDPHSTAKYPAAGHIAMPYGSHIRKAAMQRRLVPSNYAAANTDELWAETVTWLALGPTMVPKPLAKLVRQILGGTALESIEEGGSVPASIANAVRRNPEKFREAWSETGDDGGYWVLLQNGWCADDGVHAVHEWSTKDVLAAMRRVKPCRCADCHTAEAIEEAMKRPGATEKSWDGKLVLPFKDEVVVTTADAVRATIAAQRKLAMSKELAALDKQRRGLMPHGVPQWGSDNYKAYVEVRDKIVKLVDRSLSSVFAKAGFPAATAQNIAERMARLDGEMREALLTWSDQTDKYLQDTPPYSYDAAMKAYRDDLAARSPSLPKTKVFTTLGDARDGFMQMRAKYGQAFLTTMKGGRYKVSTVPPANGSAIGFADGKWMSGIITSHRGELLSGVGNRHNAREVNGSVVWDGMRNESVNEVAPPGFSGTVRAMKDKHPEIGNPFALAWGMYKRGAKPHYKPEKNSKGIKRYLKPETYAKMKADEAAENFTPPAAVAAEARRGLELRKKWKRGGLDTAQASAQGIGSGVVRAAQLANRKPIAIDTVKRMAAFFSRHAKNYQPDKKEADGGPTAGTIAFFLWGGNAGRDWADSMISQAGKSEGLVTVTVYGRSNDYALRDAIHETLRAPRPSAAYEEVCGLLVEGS